MEFGRFDTKRLNKMTFGDILPNLDPQVAETWNGYVRAASFVLARPKVPVTLEDGTCGYRLTVVRTDKQPHAFAGTSLDFFPTSGTIVFSDQGRNKVIIGNVVRAGIVAEDGSFFVEAGNEEYTEKLKVTAGGGLSYEREPINPDDRHHRIQKGILVRGQTRK